MLLHQPLIAALFSLLIAVPAFADDRVEHFEGESAETLEQAIRHFTDYNRKLQALLEGEISNADLGDIHQITYTLENALGKLKDELSELEKTLEEVHVASETADRETVKDSGKAYLAVAEALEQLAD